MRRDRGRDPRAEALGARSRAPSWMPSFIRAIAAQARGALGDLTLLGASASALLLSLSLATGVPSDLGTASAAEKDLAAAALTPVVAVYAAVMAAIYGSFRYTIDLRVGVVAQRATLQRRGASIAARAPFTAFGGAVVAVLALTGGRVALAPVLGSSGLGPGVVVQIVVVGAVSALWGLGVGLLVRAHLVALFIAPLSLSSAVLIGVLWPEPAMWMPLPSLLQVVGFDLAALGFAPGATAMDPRSVVSGAIAATWTGVVLGAGIVSFLRRDVI